MNEIQRHAIKIVSLSKILGHMEEFVHCLLFACIIFFIFLVIPTATATRKLIRFGYFPMNITHI